MGQMTKNVCELLPSGVCDLYAPRPNPAGSRTVLKQYLLDPVLPVLTLLCMSALTIVLLVAVVTAVADMDVALPDGYVSVDPWSGRGPGSASADYPDLIAYPDFRVPVEATEEPEYRLDDPQPESPLEVSDAAL